MKTIYEPAGRAREYSALALNVYLGCEHGCKYCYIQDNRDLFIAKYRNGLLEQLKKDIPKYPKNKYILLSFISDPYPKIEQKERNTRKILELLLKEGMSVCILSKSGSRILDDLDLFKQYKNQLAIAFSLTLYDNDLSLKYENGAASPSERIETLKEIKANNLRTWVSFEPVLFPNETYKLFAETKDYVDLYKIGKLNHFENLENNINWSLFLNEITNKMVMNGKDFYIKDDLSYHGRNTRYPSENCRNADYWALNHNLKEVKELSLF